MSGAEVGCHGGREGGHFDGAERVSQGFGGGGGRGDQHGSKGDRGEVGVGGARDEGGFGGGVQGGAAAADDDAVGHAVDGEHHVAGVALVDAGHGGQEDAELVGVGDVVGAVGIDGGHHGGAGERAGQADGGGNRGVGGLDGGDFLGRGGALNGAAAVVCVQAGSHGGHSGGGADVQGDRTAHGSHDVHGHERGVEVLGAGGFVVEVVAVVGVDDLGDDAAAVGADVDAEAAVGPDGCRAEFLARQVVDLDAQAVADDDGAGRDAARDHGGLGRGCKRAFAAAAAGNRCNTAQTKGCQSKGRNKSRCNRRGGATGRTGGFDRTRFLARDGGCILWHGCLRQQQRRFACWHMLGLGQVVVGLFGLLVFFLFFLFFVAFGPLRLCVGQAWLNARQGFELGHQQIGLDLVVLQRGGAFVGRLSDLVRNRAFLCVGGVRKRLRHVRLRSGLRSRLRKWVLV